MLVLEPIWSLELALVGLEAGTFAVLIAGLEELTGPGLCLIAIMLALGAGGKAGVTELELVELNVELEVALFPSFFLPGLTLGSTTPSTFSMRIFDFAPELELCM